MNEDIKKILEDLRVDGKKIPVEHINYKGNSKTFVTWTMLMTIPDLYGDDEVLGCIDELDIDVYSDGNYLGIMNEVKRLMKNNGWMWTEDSEEMYEDDTELYHRTMTFHKERMIVDG